MFRSKTDIDRHVKDIFNRCNSPEQRSLESLKIANLYMKIKDYKSAKTFAQQYLTVKPSDAAGHETLGVCHKGLGSKPEAFEEFKIALSLNLNNKSILKELATLAIDDQVPLDLVKDKYWIERIEQCLIMDPNESFKLKEKLVKMTKGSQTYNQQYEDLLTAELNSNPYSLEVHLKMLKLYKLSNRIQDAYNFVTTKTNQSWNQYVWYKELVDVCAQFESQVAANEKKLFYVNYVINVEKELKFALQEGKNTTDLEKSLVLLNNVITLLKQNTTNLDNTANLKEKLIVEHYITQLCFYKMLVELKKYNIDLASKPELFKEKIRHLVPILLVGLNPGLVLDFKPSSHGIAGPDNLAEMKAETHYRVGQCSLFLGILRKHGFLKDIKAQDCKEWLEDVLSSYNCAKDTSVKASDLTLLNTEYIPCVEHISGTDLSHPYSLHHMVWLGVAQSLLQHPPAAQFKSCLILPKLQFAARNIHLIHMNLCSLDVDAFLYATVLCALSKLPLGSPCLLPADITPSSLLVTSEQQAWWTSVFTQLKNPHIKQALISESHVQQGIQLIRNVSQLPLHVAILVHLGRCFARRASDTSLSSSKDKVRALEIRSQHYWEAALPMLERLEKNKNMAGVSDTLFRYHGEPITSIEAVAMIEEAKCTLGCFLLNADKLKDASSMLKPLKSAFAKYNLAKIYVRLADDEFRNCASQSEAFETSLLNTSGSLTASYKVTIFLQKAKDALLAAQARFDVELATPCLMYYPDLSTRILDLLTEVELKMDQAEGIEDNGLNVSNSSFSHTNRVSTAQYSSPAHFSSPISNIRSNPHLRNISQRLYFSPEPSNTNGTHVQHAETLQATQIELLLERVKRQQDMVDRVNDNVSNIQRQVLELSEKLETVLDSNKSLAGMHDETNKSLASMHTKYLSVLESIKDLVSDRTDIIKDNTENLNVLTAKVNQLMGDAELDKDYLLADDYPEINPSFYPEATPKPSFNIPTAGTPGFYQTPGLPFSEGQSLPTFFDPSTLNLSQGPPVVIPPTMPIPLNIPQTPAPPLSVTIPPQHLLANKNKINSGGFPPVSNLINPSISIPTSKLAPVPAPFSNLPPAVPGACIPTMFAPSSVAQASWLNPAASLTGQKLIFGQTSAVGPTKPCAPLPAASGATPASVFGGFANSSPSATAVKPAGSQLNTPPRLQGVPLQYSPAAISALNSSGASPHNFQIQMPTKITETSPLVKQVLEQSAVESDDEEDAAEIDPMPNFKPIIDLPDEVEVCTGEENETVLFEKRAKLFRFVDKEWKERGIGPTKLLENKDTKKVRLLMRRETVHKICANHFLHPDMELTPMKGNNKAYIWFAKDFADETVSEEQLCIRFKTPEEAEEFKAVFTKYKNAMKASPVTKTKSTDKVSVGGSSGTGFSKELTQVKPGNWECTQCYVMNPAGDRCVACGSANPKAKTIAPTTPASNKYHLGGLTFSSTPVLKKENEGDNKSKPENKPGSIPPQTPNPLASFTFSSMNQPPTSNLFVSLGAKPHSGGDAGFKFGSTPAQIPTQTTEGKSEGFPTLKTLLSSPAAVSSGVDFAALAKSGTSSPFSGSAGFKGFPGAGTAVFSNLNKSVEQNKSGGDKENDDSSPGVSAEEFVPTAEFEPVIALPDLVKVVTGEEGCEVLWESRCKLLRFDTTDDNKKEWKERGLGVMKLLKDPAQGIVRLLMRREQVLKVCCNQRITRDFELKALSTSDKAWTWYNQDFSEGDGKTELFALRLKNYEQAQEFKTRIEQVVAELKASPSPSKPTAASTTKVGSGDSKPSLSALFHSSAGSWECTGCFLRNAGEVTSCPACNTVKPGSEKTVKKTEGVVKPRFSFGIPSSGAAPPVAVPQFQPASNVTTSFSYGIPASSTITPAYSFGTKTSPSSTSVNSSLSSAALTSTSTLASVTSGASFAFGSVTSQPAADLNAAGFSFATRTSSDGKEEQKTPEKIISQEGKENNALHFGSNTFTFLGIKPASPRQHNTSGGYRTESESEADTTAEEEQDIHFQPVIPLPSLVELTTGEENETIVYVHRAKLFRYAAGEWKERGVGDVKLLRHNDSGKLRFIMRREPIEKICLNHFVDASLQLSAKDDKTWLWAALDYAEEEWSQERFAMRFKTAEIAQEFKRAVDNAVGKAEKTESADEEIQIIHVKRPDCTAEEKANIAKYKLPALFYDYKKKDPCPGCAGCEQDSEPDTPTSSTFSLSAFGTKPIGTSFLAPTLFKAPKQSTPAGTPTSVSFASSASPIVLGTEKHNDSLPSLDSQKFSTPTANIFSVSPSTANTTGSNLFSQSNNNDQSNAGENLFKPSENLFKPSPGLFGSGTTKLDGNIFGSKPSENVFGHSGFGQAKFGMNVSSIFGGSVASGDAVAATPAPLFGQNIFSGSDDKKSLFQSSSPFSTTVPTTNAGSNSFFGLKSSKLETVSSAQPSGGSFSTGMSIFGAATQPSFGSVAPNKSITATSPSLVINSPAIVTPDTKPESKGNISNTESSVTSIPSFLNKVGDTPSFADLASQSNSSFKHFSGGQFKVEGSDSTVFGKVTSPKVNKSRTGEEDEEEDNGANGEHDPHFEPIIALPDEVQVRTGEEDEIKVYGERCKLYRYDKETKEWKERGVGELKLLHHVEKLTYRLLMRRDQIHKIVANFLLWPGLEMKPMATSDRAWVFTAMNLAEDYEVPEPEELALRFKDSTKAEEFKKLVEQTVIKVAEIKANSSIQNNTSQATAQEVASEEEVDVEGVVEEEGDDEEDDDDYEDGYEIVEDEEDIDYSDMLKMDTLVEHPVVLLKKGGGKWETVANGVARIIATVGSDTQYGYRVQVVNQEEDVSLETGITHSTTLQRKGKAIVWKGVDDSTEEDDLQDIMLKFQSEDDTETFLQLLQEGVQIAQSAQE